MCYLVRYRQLYQEGYSPICPVLFQSDFLDDGDAKEHKDRLDMAEELLRRSRVVVACSTKVNENVKNDIALAKRLGIGCHSLICLGKMKPL